MPRRTELRAALERLWRLPPPGPRNLYASPEFAALADACATYGGGKPTFGLGTALRALGLPCGLPADRQGDSLSVVAAVRLLEKALTRRTTTRRYLCPLDLAQSLPPLRYGNVRLQQFSVSDLDAMFDAPRARRYYPNARFEPERLALFQWLVVEETVKIDPRPEARAMPFLFEGFNRDTGAFDPHRGTFPEAVEAALFFLLLAPWEDWSTMPEVDWRGFRIPWIHVVDEDLFVRPSTFPTADSLTLEPWIVHDDWGEEEELERPAPLPLEDGAEALADWTDERWRAHRRACRGPLLETPVAHFLVRGFVGHGIDEVMAHMTAIEAALGTREDGLKGKGKKPLAPTTATGRVCSRIAALLSDAEAALVYKDLFELRSAFVHGRGGLDRVSTTQRVDARRLAGRVAAALIDIGGTKTRTRQDVLDDLFERGRAGFIAAEDARKRATSKGSAGDAGEENAL